MVVCVLGACAQVCCDRCFRAAVGGGNRGLCCLVELCMSEAMFPPRLVFTPKRVLSASTAATTMRRSQRMRRRKDTSDSLMPPVTRERSQTLSDFYPQHPTDSGFDCRQLLETIHCFQLVCSCPPSSLGLYLSLEPEIHP